MDARGFGYRRLSEILAQGGFIRAPLQTVGPAETQEGGGVPYVLVCRAMARGQGKTEGLHERRIRVTPEAVGAFLPEKGDELAAISRARLNEAGEIGRILRRALMVLFQNGPERDRFAPRDPNSADRAAPFLGAFDRGIDADFFDHLFAEVAAGGESERTALCARWLTMLKDRARAMLAGAEAGAPTSSVRRLRSRVRAEAALDAGFRKAFGATYFPKERPHDVA